MVIFVRAVRNYFWNFPGNTAGQPGDGCPATSYFTDKLVGLKSDDFTEYILLHFHSMDQSHVLFRRHYI